MNSDSNSSVFVTLAAALAAKIQGSLFFCFFFIPEGQIVVNVGTKDKHITIITIEQTKKHNGLREDESNLQF